MDIGLQTGAITSVIYSGNSSNGGGGSQEPAGLTPIPGILDAPNVIVLGASIMDSGFGSGHVLRSSVADYALAAGFTGTLHTRSSSGARIADTQTHLAAVQAEADIAATAGQNLYLVHTGGNNVSAFRPWPGSEAIFSTEYTTLMQQITSSSDLVIPMPLTKRLYTSAPTVVHGDSASEENGSKPYNENIIYPAIDTYAPVWRTAGEAPFVNPYEIGDRYPQTVGSDGIHGYFASIARYILSRIAARALGKTKEASRRGTSILYSPEKGEPNNIAIGSVNRFMSWGGGSFQNCPLLYGAITEAGDFDPFIEVTTNDVFQNASTNAGTGTYARIPDARFHSTDVVNRGIYVQGTKTYQMIFAGLTPGDTLTVSAVGVRNASGTNRRGDLTLSTGQTLTLDASNIATSNQVTFDPVAVPASGEITLSLSVTPGATYGYLHGVMLDFS